MILLAGCSGGGGGPASPTDGSTETPTPEVEIDMSQPSDPSALSNTSGEESNAFANATRFDVALYNGTSQLTLMSETNPESGASLLRLDSSTGGTNTLYNSSDYVALRNSTTGEVEYGEPSDNVGFGVAFASVFVLGASAEYSTLVAWEPAGTTAVDGEGAFVYESDSLNESAFDSERTFTDQFEQGDVQSVDGRMVISPDGRIHSITVDIETAGGTYGTNMSVQYDDITVTQPGWVDESEAP